MTNYWRIDSKNFVLVACLMMLMNISAANEQIISSRLADNKTVTAELRSGEPGSPAVLIVHGFLQTRNYLTVSTIAESAAEAGYTVLTPTLSLGVSERKKSLQCDAIHVHSFEEDVAEIDYWVKWLEKKGHNKIVVIGHSYGSLQLLGYLLSHSSSSISQFIATSLLDISKEQSTEKLQAYLLDARNKVKNADISLGEYAVSYCKKYISPASAYLSYAEWSRERILNSVKKLDIPITVILGSKDKRLDPDWQKELKIFGAKVIMIKGANHFFAADHEFDLLEAVQKLLR